VYHYVILFVAKKRPFSLDSLDLLSPTITPPSTPSVLHSLIATCLESSLRVDTVSRIETGIKERFFGPRMAS